MGPGGGKRPERGTALTVAKLYAPSDDSGGFYEELQDHYAFFAFGQRAVYMLTESETSSKNCAI